MMQIQYAFRDDEKTISLLVQGRTEKSPICQIITLSRREIMPEFLDQFLALDIKKSSYPATALTELGRNMEINEAYRRCLVRIRSQIEFTVKPRIMKRLEEFLPAYNATGLYNFFDGQPYGYITALQVFETTSEIPDFLMQKGRRGAGQIIQFHNQNGQKTYFNVSEPITPLIDEGIFEYIRDEIIHELRVENALIGIYENDEESKRLLQQKRDSLNGLPRHIYDENENIDRSFLDYGEVYREIVELDTSLAKFVAQVQTIKPPQMAECQTLLPKAVSGDETARTRLVEMYIRTAFKNALYFAKKYNLPIADTIQDGLVGLVTSVDKFDLTESTAFQSYSQFWVYQQIRRRMPQYIYTRYFPIHIHEKLMTIREIAIRLSITMPPDANQRKKLLFHVCEEMTLSEEQAESFLSYLETTFESLDEISDLLEESDKAAKNYPCLVVTEDALFNCIEKIELKDTITKCLDSLSPREKEVLTLRYGLNGDDFKTLEEVGKVYGVTRERVRQIEAKAIKKLQRTSNRKRLIDFY